MRSLKEANVRNKRVLVRVDFDVPLKNGRIVDDSRIRAALPTINFLRKKKAKIILMSHLGRPGGKFSKNLTLKPVAKKLSTLLRKKVLFADGRELKPGDILLLENLRFHKGEESNNKLFAKRLAAMADIYVNDAFATAHRSHASIEAITKFLPSYAGFLLQKEIKVLTTLLKKPKRPFIAIIGGVKISTKIATIENLLKKVDAILIGSAMACDFLKATGHSIGKSKVNAKDVKLAKTLLKKAKEKIILPTDLVTNSKVVPALKIPKNEIVFDIGPETQAIYSEIIKKAKTIFWNGPMGLFEITKFSKGTQSIARAVSESKATSIIGGGDTIEAAKKLKFTHISTGGGASLTLLSGKKLPAVKALR